MKQIQQEEIFAWFKNLSGAKRIELMCGLISMCIPLEVRFFETFIQDAVKKDYSSFRDAEIKANSYQELDMVCKCDLLLEKIPTVVADPYYDETTEMNGNGNIANNANTNAIVASNSNNATGTTSQTNTNNSTDAQGQVITNNSSGPNTNKVSAAGSGSTTGGEVMSTISNIITSYPSRSKLIISLCLMQPSNSTCSTIVFDSIRKQLMPENVCTAVYHYFLPKNINIDQLFSELLLLLTMAMYHPAFTYEQRDLLTTQKKDIERLYYEILSYIRSQQLLAAHSVQVPIGASVVSTQVAPSQTTVPPPAPVPQTSTTSGPGAAVVITSSSSGQGQPQQPQTMYHSTTNPSGQSSQTQATPHQAAQPHHTQPPHQYHHAYHQPSANKSHHQNTGPPPHLGPPPVAPSQFTFSFTPMPMANIAYTAPPQGPVPNMNNQTNAVIQNMNLLKVNSPQQSSSPSPSISPSSGANSKIPVPTSGTTTASVPCVTSNPMGQFPLKIDQTTIYATTATGLAPTNSVMPLVDATNAPGVPPGATICIPTLVMDDGSKSSVSSTTSVSSSASCYNCGNMGHRGTECKTSAVSTSNDDVH